MPKIGGISWNNSPGSKPGVTDKFSCPHCRRQYKMDWALQNHVKVCPLNPNRYGGVCKMPCKGKGKPIRKPKR